MGSTYIAKNFLKTLNCLTNGLSHLLLFKLAFIEICSLHKERRKIQYTRYVILDFPLLISLLTVEKNENF